MCGSFSLFGRAAEHHELCAHVLRGLCLFGKAARCAAVLCDEETDVELLHQRPVQRVGEGSLHRKDVFVGNVSGFTGGDAVQRGQNAGEQPRRVNAGKGSKLLGPGGQ